MSKFKAIKVKVQNDSCPEKYLYMRLPINEDEILMLTSDILGRDPDGYLLYGSYSVYVTRTKEPIESIYDFNAKLIEENDIEMPKYMYGENPYVFKENGIPYKGTFDSRLMPLLDGER